MSVNSYDKNTEIKLTGMFYDPTGTVLTDPDSVTVEVKKPDGTTITYSGVQRVSIGVYIVVIIADVSGVWEYHFQGTGACQVGGEKQFVVKGTSF